jgi:hypothetical protein
MYMRSVFLGACGVLFCFVSVFMYSTVSPSEMTVLQKTQPMPLAVANADVATSMPLVSAPQEILITPPRHRNY